MAFYFVADLHIAVYVNPVLHFKRLLENRIEINCMMSNLIQYRNLFKSNSF